jgi:hypothetical protein
MGGTKIKINQKVKEEKSKFFLFILIIIFYTQVKQKKQSHMCFVSHALCFFISHTQFIQKELTNIKIKKNKTTYQVGGEGERSSVHGVIPWHGTTSMSFV